MKSVKWGLQVRSRPGYLERLYHQALHHDLGVTTEPLVEEKSIVNVAKETVAMIGRLRDMS